MTLKCEMTETCTNTVSHIGVKGYVYCAVHGKQRLASGYERTRQLTAREKAHLESIGSLEKY